ncbi:MAG: diguanylate cyclase, partial [Acidiferrobacterales bacterium]
KVKPVVTSDTDDFSQPKRPYILIVEDSPTTLAVISSHLSEYVDIISASNGEQAWELVQQDRDIRLVLTDIVMPGLSGHQLLVKIRKSDDARIKNLPVFMMTTGVDITDRHLAFLNGANDFLTKPVDPIELQARINVHHNLANTILELEKSRNELKLQATTDPLTKLQNRRVFFEEGEKAMFTTLRYKTDLSIILLDIDYFKKVNDIYGHHAGDVVLVKVSQLLESLVRHVDIVARVGGEEFSILLPGTNRLGAAVLAERIRKSIETAVTSVDAHKIQISISAGLVTASSENCDKFGDLVKIADKRLYIAKNSGRNRICVSDEGKSDFS